MPNIGRGTYEPPSDDVNIFNGGEDDDDAEGSRLPLLIVVSLFVLAAFGGVVWVAYQHGVAQGRSDPRVIAAQAGPAKVPADQTASASPYKGLKIYQQQAPADEAADRLSAPPTTAQVPDTEVVVPPKAETATPKPETATPKPTDTTLNAPPATVAKAGPPPQIRTAAQTPQPDATSPPAQLGLKTPIAPAPAASGAYVLQIGAYKSEDEASTAWRTYQTKHAGTLSGYAQDIKKVDLGAKGTWYRLRVGSFASKDSAAALCGKLTAEGGACFPAK